MAAPTEQAATVTASIGNISSLLAMVIGLPAAVVAIITLAKHVKCRRRASNGELSSLWMMDVDGRCR